MRWEITDTNEQVVLYLSNSTLFHTMEGSSSTTAAAVDATVSTDRQTLVALALGTITVSEAVQQGRAAVSGQSMNLPAQLFKMLTVFEMQFDVMGVGLPGAAAAAAAAGHSSSKL